MITASLYSAGKSETTPPASVAESGILTYLEGDVLVNNNPAEIGDLIESSDTIATGTASYCEIVFDQSNIFRMDENTITQINWNQSDIQLQKGSISAVLTKLDKFLNKEKDFTFTTPTVAAGVRGTVFFMKVEDDNNSYLCICNGKLNVEASGTEQEIASQHHKAYRFTRKGDKVETTSAPLLYHDDEKMDSVASSIDYIVPWDKTGNY
jgi:hypothetical protein